MQLDKATKLQTHIENEDSTHEFIARIVGTMIACKLQVVCFQPKSYMVQNNLLHGICNNDTLHTKIAQNYAQGLCCMMIVIAISMWHPIIYKSSLSYQQPLYCKSVSPCGQLHIVSPLFTTSLQCFSLSIYFQTHTKQMFESCKNNYQSIQISRFLEDIYNNLIMEHMKH